MKLAALTALLLIWSAFVWYAPDTVYWRDSGEFLLSPYFLDIPHPAGFPLYSQSANLFTFLPFGPIAWRTHLFCAGAAAAVLALCCWCAHTLTSRLQAGSPLLRLFPALAALVILSGSAAVLKQAVTAEVYALNAALLLAVFLLVLRFERSSDLRCLLCAAFVGGLACANHLSAALPLALGGVILLTLRRSARAAWLPALVCVTAGLSVYGYLPARAAASPPLNTGEPSTVQRFVRQITDARDRDLRAAQPTVDAPAGTETGRALVETVSRDAAGIQGEIPWPLLLCSALGFAALLIGRPIAALLLASIAAGNYLFFTGWDPDPWIPLIAVLALTAALGLTTVVESLGRAAPLPGARLILAAVAAAAIAAAGVNRGAFAALNDQRSYRAPEAAARDILDRHRRAAVIVLEHSWFIVRYLTALESYRDAIVPVYQPGLLFPGYFSVPHLRDGEREFKPSDEPGSASSALIKNAARLIEFASTAGAVGVEPSTMLNSSLRNLLILDAGGAVEARRGQAGPQIEPTFVNSTAAHVERIRSHAVAHPALERDATNYLDNILNSYGNLLASVGAPDAAARLLREACTPLEEQRCSLVTRNHLALIYLQLKENFAAADLLARLLSRPSLFEDQLLYNLAVAVRALSPLELQRLKEDPAAVAALERLPR